jgi:peroxiredoxin 5
MTILSHISGCSKTHLPSYIQKEQELKSKGVNEIICVRCVKDPAITFYLQTTNNLISQLFSVNDPFVMAAWGNQFETKNKIRMLADPSGNFSKAVDLTIDLPPLGKFTYIFKIHCHA